jgi:hypothetical protein
MQRYRLKASQTFVGARQIAAMPGVKGRWQAQCRLERSGSTTRFT